MSAKIAYNIANYCEVHATNFKCYLAHTGDQMFLYMNRGAGVAKVGICNVSRPGFMTAAEEEEGASESHLAKTTDLLDLKRLCSHHSKDFLRL